MSLLWMEGWKQYREPSDLAPRYGLEGIGATSGSNLELLSSGGPTLLPNSPRPRQSPAGALHFKGENLNEASVKITGDGEARIKVGFYFKLESWNPVSDDTRDTVLQLWATGQSNPNCSLQIDRVYSNVFTDFQYCLSAYQATSSSQIYRGYDLDHYLNLDQWYYIEIDMLLGTSSTGSFELRVDGEVWYSNSAISTSYTGVNTIDEIWIGTTPSSYRSGGNYYVSDFWLVSPDAGSGVEDYLYPAIVETLYPDAEVAGEIDFTPSAGADNSAMVDEAPAHDYDTTYNESNTVAHKDRFEIADSMEAGNNEIYGAQVHAMVKDTLETAGRDARCVIFQTATEYQGSTLDLDSTGWQALHHMWELNPDTSAAWTKPEVLAAEIGYEIVI